MRFNGAASALACEAKLPLQADGDIANTKPIEKRETLRTEYWLEYPALLSIRFLYLCLPVLKGLSAW